MNRTEAESMDHGSRYVDFDEETQMWGIFGTESGFCYTLHGSKDAAEECFKA